MLLTLADEMAMLIPIIAIVGGLIIAAIGMIGGLVRSVKREKEREQSRREVAAYVAEGSMSAEDATKILEAGLPDWEGKKRPGG